MGDHLRSNLDFSRRRPTRHRHGTARAACGKARFFQGAQKVKTRYATLGFTDKANLDKGDMWPTSFALKRLGPGEERQNGALLTKAVG